VELDRLRDLSAPITIQAARGGQHYGVSVTGLLDFESVRLADPLFDVAWWEWAVSFAPPSVLEAAWRPFLEATATNDPERIRTLQILRMLELLASPTALTPEIRSIVADRLRGTPKSAGTPSNSSELCSDLARQ
jgi:hypothetical protein